METPGEQQRQQPSPTPPPLIFYTGFALLIAHELDTVAQAEWRLLPFLGRLPDPLAFAVFVAAHVPLLAGLMWLAAHPTARIRRRAQLGVDAFLIAHAGLHWALSGMALYTFYSGLSRSLIIGGGLVGLVHLVMLLRSES